MGNQFQVGQADGVQYNCLALPSFISWHPFLQTWQLSSLELASSLASGLALIILSGSSKGWVMLQKVARR